MERWFSAPRNACTTVQNVESTQSSGNMERELSDQVLVLFHNIFARLKIISKISKTTPSYSDVPKFNSKVEHNNKEIIVDGSVSEQ